MSMLVVQGKKGLLLATAPRTVLHIVLDTYTSYDRGGEVLDKSRLRIAELLIERGAVIDGVADHLEFVDVLKFVGFEDS